MRTLELMGAIVEHMGAKKGLSPPDGAPYPRPTTQGVRPETIHKTPFNPIFNPRYAVTTSTKPLPASGKSTGGRSSTREWHVTKSQALAELEAQLKTIGPRKKAFATPKLTPVTGAPAAATRRQMTGTKRKADASPDESIENEQRPGKRPAWQQCPQGSSASASRRRPGDSKPAVTSRFGVAAAAEAAEARAQAVRPQQRQGSLPPTSARKSSVASKGQQPPQTPAAERAQKANEAYLARMRKAAALRGRSATKF